VYIAYFTTFVDNGHLFFGNDLYDRDSKLVTELQSAALPPPETREAQRLLRAMADSSQHSS
jgi:hypothetical protein